MNQLLLNMQIWALWYKMHEQIDETISENVINMLFKILNGTFVFTPNLRKSGYTS